MSKTKKLDRTCSLGRIEGQENGSEEEDGLEGGDTRSTSKHSTDLRGGTRKFIC